jgi:hypothetical protein
VKGHKMNYRNRQKYNEVGPDSARVLLNRFLVRASRIPKVSKS